MSIVKADRYRGIEVITSRYNGAVPYQSQVIAFLGVIESMNADTEEEALSNHERLLQGQISAIKSAQRSLWRSCVARAKILLEDGFIGIEDVQELVDIIRGHNER